MERGISSWSASGGPFEAGTRIAAPNDSAFPNENIR